MTTLYDINGSFKMLNAAGKVTKRRSGFEPVTADVLADRISRSQARIRSLTTAINDMQELLDAGDAPYDNTRVVSLGR